MGIYLVVGIRDAKCSAVDKTLLLNRYLNPTTNSNAIQAEEK